VTRPSYAWKTKYAHLGVSGLRQLRQLEVENGRLKRLVADLSLDKPMLSEALRKKSKARTLQRTGRLVLRRAINPHGEGVYCVSQTLKSRKLLSAHVAATPAYQIEINPEFRCMSPLFIRVARNSVLYSKSRLLYSGNELAVGCLSS
jgi:DNA-binding MarR family transcriptional regulator